jgi:hypothetical protein
MIATANNNEYWRIIASLKYILLDLLEHNSRTYKKPSVYTKNYHNVKIRPPS